MKRFALLLLITGCASQGPARPVHFVVLHTNDIHGHAWASDGRGGYAAQAFIVDRIRRENASGITLVLSGGDVNTGVPDSDLLLAEPDFAAMNRIGYDAMAMGNHELDGGVAKLKRQVGWAKFPILSANVFDKNAPLVGTSVVIERRGIKIGILGLTTETLKHIALPQHVESLVVKDVVETAKSEVEKLKRAGAEIIFAVTHVGVSETGKRAHVKIVNDDVAIARAVPEIAAIIGGHSHTLLPHGITVDKRLVVQAGEKGEHLGRLDIEWDAATHEIVSEKSEMIDVVASVGEDAAVKKELETFHVDVGKRLDAQVGTADIDLLAERDMVRGHESNLGNFLCDVMRTETKSDVAFFNSGGIRASVHAGPIALRDLYKVMPFANIAVTGDMSGKQVKEALQRGVDYRNTGGGFLQVSGLSYVIKDGKVVEVLKDGKALGDAVRLKVVTNNFVFAGGDFHEEFKAAQAQNDTGIRIEDMVAAFLRKHPRVGTRLEGRIREK